jgi:predicted dehydrogenase
MGSLEKLQIGLVGACGRGGSFRAGVEATGAAVIHAICDINADGLDEAKEKLGANVTYTNYIEMLDSSGIDAVVVGTPMPLHVPQSIEALERNIHAMSEVPAAVSIDQCRDLVAAQARSEATYMMAENFTYTRQNMLVAELVRRGLFGHVYYAEGEYLHELKGLNEITTWRRQWQTGIAGITYGTHSLGPILKWMPGDRVVRVCCEGSGQHYTDPRGEPYAQDTCVMLGKTARGSLIKIRVDMVSDRPHSMMNYQLQGTDGAYESGRGGPVDEAKIWLRKLSDEVKWMALDDLDDSYLPEAWRETPDAAQRAGHGGGDYFEMLDFVDACLDKRPCPIGVHEALDFTLPGLVSQQSIAQAGAWLDVPDSRGWGSDQ